MALTKVSMGFNNNVNHEMNNIWSAFAEINKKAVTSHQTRHQTSKLVHEPSYQRWLYNSMGCQFHIVLLPVKSPIIKLTIDLVKKFKSSTRLEQPLTIYELMQNFHQKRDQKTTG